MRLAQRKMLWLWMVMWYLLAGSSAEVKSPKEVIGTLGDSTIFLLDSPSQFDTVLWLKNRRPVASLSQGPPCQLKRYGAFDSRNVAISEDCSSLTIRGVRKEDSARYTALMMNSDDEVVASQTFTLKVYKRLSEADLDIVCTKKIHQHGNETLQLICTAGKWKDGMNYTWTSSGQSGKVLSSGKYLTFLYKPQNNDRNITCMAENPMGDASLKQVCAGTSAERKLSKEMTGILGESATFSLESPSQIRDAVWGGNSLKVATLKWGPPCQLEPGDAYTSRDMTVSSDCRSLTIGDLCEEDSGEYMALFVTVDNHLSTQNVTLKVYKCLSEADLEVFCGKEILGDGNKTLHLICSAGKWEDGVEFSWTSASPSSNVSEKSLVLLSNPQEDDMNITCMVENPIGNASRTVSLKQACDCNTEESSGLE